MNLCIILNASAGSLIGLGIDKVKAEIKQGFEQAGHKVELRTPEGKQLVSTLQDAAQGGFDAIVIGGGDGTIATAADICAHADVTLGVLPLGTMNMLAKDLHIPLTLPEAIAALGQAETRRIDMAEVNGESFLCNSTLGLVPFVGEERENQRGRSHWRMVPAMIRKVVQAAWIWPALRLSLSYDGRKRHTITRLLTIANNAYADGPNGGFMTRDRLDGGVLTVYLSRHHSRLGLLWFTIGLMLHFWHRNPRLETITTTELVVKGGRWRSLAVCNDGEIKKLRYPLRYRIKPGALKVLVPRTPSPPTGGEGA